MYIRSLAAVHANPSIGKAWLQHGAACEKLQQWDGPPAQSRVSTERYKRASALVLRAKGEALPEAAAEGAHGLKRRYNLRVSGFNARTPRTAFPQCRSAIHISKDTNQASASIRAVRAHPSLDQEHQTLVG